jgi:hypothetical protein
MTARWSGVFSGDAETRPGEDLEVERWRVHPTALGDSLRRNGLDGCS